LIAWVKATVELWFCMHDTVCCRVGVYVFAGERRARLVFRRWKKGLLLMCEVKASVVEL
jgi:hypothetical protein